MVSPCEVRILSVASPCGEMKAHTSSGGTLRNEISPERSESPKAMPWQGCTPVVAAYANCTVDVQVRTCGSLDGTPPCETSLNVMRISTTTLI